MPFIALRNETATYAMSVKYIARSKRTKKKIVIILFNINFWNGILVNSSPSKQGHDMNIVCRLESPHWDPPLVETTLGRKYLLCLPRRLPMLRHILPHGFRRSVGRTFGELLPVLHLPPVLQAKCAPDKVYPGEDLLQITGFWRSSE